MTMLEQLRRQLAALLESRAARRAELDTLIAAVRARGDDAEMTADESARFDTLVGEVRGFDTGEDTLRTRIGDLELVEQRSAAHHTAQERSGSTAVVTSEPRTYTRELSASEGRSMIVDLYRSQFSGDLAAADRINRHRREIAVDGGGIQVRDVGTATFGGLIPPQYLLDLFAPIARAGRPFANMVRSAPLPATGMSIVIPRGTTGTAAGVQATQNSAVQLTDYAETDLTVPIVTVAGQANLSRQAVERGIGTDEIIFADLAADYAVKLDGQVLSGTGAGGQALGLLATAGVSSVAYTDATPTVAEVWPKFSDAIQRINSLRFMPATAICMHPRRWGWITSALDTQGRPLFNFTTGPQPVLSSFAVGEAATYGQVVGTLQGLPVVTDASLPTTWAGGAPGAGTEDAIIVVRAGTAGDPILWEDGDGVPKQLKFEETIAGSLTIKLVVYGYIGFTAGRYPAGVSIIGGTGLVVPTF